MVESIIRKAFSWPVFLCSGGMQTLLINVSCIGQDCCCCLLMHLLILPLLRPIYQIHHPPNQIRHQRLCQEFWLSLFLKDTEKENKLESNYLVTSRI